MNAKKTVKITIEGVPEMVDLVAASMRGCFHVTQESQNNRIQLRPNDVRRTIRILPLSDILEDDASEYPQGYKVA